MFNEDYINNQKALEKLVLEKKANLLDLKRENVIDFNLIFYDFREVENSPYTLDYFAEKNRGILWMDLGSKNISFSSINDMHIPKEGIITNDGRIYKIFVHHMYTAAWLRFCGIDLSNSVRYVKWDESYSLFSAGTKAGIAFSEGHDSLSNYGKEPKSVDELFDMWVTYHEARTTSHVVSLSEEQLYTIYNICRYFGYDMSKRLLTHDCFGFTRCADQYEGAENQLNAIHNRNMLGDVFGAKLVTYRSGETRVFEIQGL